MTRPLKHLVDTRHAKPVGKPIDIDRPSYILTRRRVTAYAKMAGYGIGEDVNAYTFVEGKLQLLWWGPEKGPKSTSLYRTDF